MTELTPEHKLLCDVATVRVHLDKYSRIEQRALLGRVTDHLKAVVEAQRTAPQALAATPAVGGEALRTALDIHELELTETMRDLGLRSKVRTIEVVFSKLREAAAQPASPLRGITDEIVETAWAAIVGSDIAKYCDSASIVRGDLKTALVAVSASPPEQPAATPVGGGLTADEKLERARALGQARAADKQPLTSDGETKV